MAVAGERVVLAEASDERLVALARAGSERGFAAIVERYRAPLLRYCEGFLPPAAAEDALQQTFINAYRALGREDMAAPAALRPWLFRVARNAALNVARDPQSGLAELPEGLDGVRRPDEVLQARERFRRVVGAVGALPPKQRQVIVRHALDGDSHERIAADLGMSAGSIRQLAHRARQTVRAAAAALVPSPLLRFLPLGADAAEVGGGAAVAKVVVAVVVAGAAGGGAVQVVRHEERPATASGHKAPARRAAPAPQAPRVPPLPAPAIGARPASLSGERASRGRGSPDRSGSSSGKRSSGRSGSGSSESSSGSSASGSGSSGSDSSGSDSGSSGSGSSESGSSASDSGSGSSGSGSGSSDSGSSGSDSESSGSSGSGTDSSDSGSGSLSSGSGSSGSGSSGSDSESSGSGTSGSGSGSSGSSEEPVLLDDD